MSAVSVGVAVLLAVLSPVAEPSPSTSASSVTPTPSPSLSPSPGGFTSSKRTVTLSPGRAPALGTIRVTVSGFGGCPRLSEVRVALAGTSLGILTLGGPGPSGSGASSPIIVAGLPGSTASPPDAGGSSSGTFQVPAGTADGPHEVTARCVIDDGNPATATLTVAPATLTADPGQGVPGSATTVSGKGFACPVGDAVALAWDTGASPVSATPDADGSFATRIPVPANAPVGDHTVHAACASVPDIKADAPFRIQTPAPTTSSPAKPSPTPITASPGAIVPVSGRADSCRRLVLALDDGPTSTPVQADGRGRFTSRATLPANVATGTHTITAECADTHAVADVVPVVVSWQVPPPNPDGHSDGHWIWIVLAFLAVAAAAVFALHHRPPLAHVTAKAGGWGDPEVELTERGGGSDGSGHSVRLEPRLGQGRQSSEELHDDDRRDG